jgi:hypothetical protein
MKRTATLLAATAMTLAALPAAAQQADGDGLTWQDVTTPSVRFIQRDAQGNTIFDSDAVADAPGASDPQMREAIERADAPDTAETDEAREGWQMDDTRAAVDVGEEPGTYEAATEGYAEGPGADPAATGDGMAQGGPSDVEAFAARADTGTEQPMEGSAMAGDLDSTDMLMSPTGEEMDMDAFAREMYAEGYRQGYVSGLTRMRAAAARQMMGQRERFDQYRTRAEARADRQSREMGRMLQGREAAERSGQAVMQREADGTTIITLPAGMTPQQFLNMIAQ